MNEYLFPKNLEISATLHYRKKKRKTSWQQPNFFSWKVNNQISAWLTQWNNMSSIKTELWRQ